MTEFIGRTGSRRLYSYPDRPRGSDAALFARNFASGPAENTEIAAVPGTQIPWSAIGVGAPGVSVPITPKSTGKVRVIASITLVSEADESVQVVAQVQVGGVTQPIPAAPSTSVEANGDDQITVLAELTLPVGVVSNIQILMIAGEASAVSLLALSSTIEVQEVPAETG